MQSFLYNTEHNLPVDTSYMHVYLRVPKDEHPRDMLPPDYQTVDLESGRKLAALKERLKASPVRTIEYCKNGSQDPFIYIHSTFSQLFLAVFGIYDRIV